jgi:hypothetical protein
VASIPTAYIYEARPLDVEGPVPPHSSKPPKTEPVDRTRRTHLDLDFLLDFGLTRILDKVDLFV